MSLINDFERQITERLAELQPLVEEHRELTALLASIRETSGKAAARPSRPPRGAKGGRATQAIELVCAHPGITVAELASRMEIGPTYLYKLLPALEKDGAVRKVGRGYEPAPAGADTSAAQPVTTVRRRESPRPARRRADG